MRRMGQLIKIAVLALAFSAAYADASYSMQDLQALNTADMAKSQAYMGDVTNLQAESQSKAAAYNTMTSFLQNTALQKSGADSQADSGNGVIVFVSLGMPVLSLREIITDANRLHVPVVVRGVLNNDFKASAKVLYDVLHPPGLDPIPGGVEIDPVWFEGYGIEQVPAVVAAPSGITCTDKSPCTPDQFDVVYGNVPITEALTHIVENGGVGKAAAAAVLAGEVHDAN